MNSIWTQTAEIKKRKSLEESIETEAAVIGGGMAGILTAYFLQKKGIDTVVLEAAGIGGGQTKNTTAKITLQHGLIYHKLIQDVGFEQAKLYMEANRHAISAYRSLIEEENIDCRFRECSSYLYSVKETEPLLQEENAAKSLGICAEYTNKTELPFEVKGALRFYDQAVFHPLMFLGSIADKVKVYENTRVINVEGNEIITEKAKVRAKHIVFAVHFPFINVPGYYFMRMHQERSYVLALKDTKQMDNIYYGIDENGLSFRKSGDIMLLGGGSHRTGENKGGGCYRELRAAAERMFPGSREIAWWSAQDCMPIDHIPYIGKYSASTPDWYAATGFKKWGMTASMVSAMLLSDMIAGKKNPYEEIFSPHRFHLQAAAPSLMKDGMKSAAGLTKGIFSAAPRCPHMGCQLEWNPDELSWDCPCHGSRFTSEGRLIDNPAQEDLFHE